MTEERTNCLATMCQPILCYAVCENQRAELRLNPVTNALATGGGKPGQGYPAVVYSFEPGVAAREGEPNRFVENVSPTIRANMGDNRTAVVYALDQQGGKGNAGFAEDVMPTLCSDSHGTPHAVCYSMDSTSSNSMKSNNPHSGIHETGVSKCLDTITSQNPCCNQGGLIIVQEDAHG